MMRCCATATKRANRPGRKSNTQHMGAHHRAPQRHTRRDYEDISEQILLDTFNAFAFALIFFSIFWLPKEGKRDDDGHLRNVYFDKTENFRCLFPMRIMAFCCVSSAVFVCKKQREIEKKNEMIGRQFYQRTGGYNDMMYICESVTWPTHAKQCDGNLVSTKFRVYRFVI